MHTNEQRGREATAAAFPRHLGRSGAVDTAPEGARRKRGTAHKKQGGLEIPRNPWRCGTLRRRTIRHAGCAERPTLRGNPAAALGGWKMGCSAPASTSAMCGRCGIHAASNSIRTNLGFMALARGRCHSLLRFSPLFLRMCTPVHINEAKPCPCFKRRALQCILVHASPVHPRKGDKQRCRAQHDMALVVTSSGTLLFVFPSTNDQHAKLVRRPPCGAAQCTITSNPGSSRIVKRISTLKYASGHAPSKGCVELTMDHKR